MHIYQENDMYIAEIEYMSEKIVKIGKTYEEAKEKLLTTLMVREMIG